MKSSISGSLRTRWLSEWLESAEPLFPAESFSSQSLAELEKRSGLSAGFLVLLHALAGDDTNNLKDLLRLILTGLATQSLASDWLVRFWPAIKADIEQPHLLNAAENVIALHSAITRRERAPTDSWKTLRDEFTRALTFSAPETSVAAAWVILAAAWDPDTVPGAFSDVVTLLYSLAEEKWKRDSGWTTEDDARVEEIAVKAMAHATEKVGQPASHDIAWRTTPEGLLWEGKFNDLFTEYYEAHGLRAMDQHEGFQRYHHDLLAQARLALRSVVIEKLNAAYKVSDN